MTNKDGAHILGLRKNKHGGWTTGVVHARVRRGEPALELRASKHYKTLRIALDSFEDADRLNGHGGCSSSLLGGTAGLESREAIIRDILGNPGAALRTVWESTGITKAEWSRRSGISVRTIDRVCGTDTTPASQSPNSRTVEALLEALQ